MPKEKSEQKDTAWSTRKILLISIIGIVVYVFGNILTEKPKTTSSRQASGESMHIRYRNAQPGDKGDYFAVSQSTNGVLYRAVSKRIGPSGTSYTRVEINCRNKSYRVLGEGTSMASINNAANPNMTRVIPGSSKYDLVNFICP